MLHPNYTKLLFLTLGLPLNQRHCNFEEHFSPSLLCGDPQTILLDKVWLKIIMITALGMEQHNFSKVLFHSWFFMFLLNSTFKKTKLTHQSKDTIKVIYCYILFFVNKHFILGPDS